MQISTKHEMPTENLKKILRFDTRLAQVQVVPIHYPANEMHTVCRNSPNSGSTDVYLRRMNQTKLGSEKRCACLTREPHI